MTSPSAPSHGGTALRYGVIGAGMMGREHIRNLHLTPGARLVAVCEPDSGQQAQTAPLAGDAELVPDLSDFLARDDLDAIVVATPNDTHFELLNRILDGPPRGVLLEKPAVTTLEQAGEIRSKAQGWPSPIWIAMEYRYMPPLARFIARVHRGDTGTPRLLSIREHRFPFLPKVGDWNRFNTRTGGTLVEKCCHFFDLMPLILRARPTRVFASGAADVNHREERYGGRVPDILDNAFATLDFDSGARAMLELCMFAEGAWFQEEITVTGDLARLECRIPGPARFWPGGAEREAELVFSPRAPKGPVRETVAVDPALLAAGDHHGATWFQHQRFLAALRGQGPVEVTLEDGLRAAITGLAAHRSITEGQAIELGPLYDQVGV